MRLGKEISLATNYVKASPAVPVYNDDLKASKHSADKGGTDLDANVNYSEDDGSLINEANPFAIIYYIEIGITDADVNRDRKYLIIDYKTYDLSEDDRDELYKLALGYLKGHNIENDDSIDIKFLDTEQASIFIEKIFNSMKTVRGLIV